jgi:hypothetical protein
MAGIVSVRDVAGQLGYEDPAGFGDAEFVDATVSIAPGARAVVWHDLYDKCGVDAAYFRGATPLAAFIATDAEERIQQVHGRLWNYSRVPVLFASREEGVSALSCLTRDSTPLASAPVTSIGEVLADFSRFSVESGRLRQRYPAQFDRKNKVDHLLLRNLRTLQSSLLGQGVDAASLEPLLGRSIFVKYLEDRGILTEEHLRALQLPASFEKALRVGWEATGQVFAAMAEHFNGDVFDRTTLPKSVPGPALAILADFFIGTDLEARQDPLWRPYDFGVIPTELISSIYEQLLEGTQRQDAAYYTPRPLVGLVLDEVLPWVGQADGIRVLDPACGSGVFLSEAFRRLSYRAASSHGGRTTYSELCALLTQSIFGVDQSRAAVGVTAFSLYLALLENVDPPTAWRDEVKLPNLIGSNLFVSDFFEADAILRQRYDIIVGNPPWQSHLSPAARAFSSNQGIAFPDRQIALAFAWKSAELVTESGTVGMVLPAKALLHNQSSPARDLRLRFFRDLEVDTTVDLSPLRRELFGSATGPAAVAFFGRRHAESPTRPYVLHVTPRRTPITQIVDELVVPQQNIRRVPQTLVQTSAGVWKQFLWGGPSDLALVRRLKTTYRSLSQFVADHGWTSGEGFQAKGGGRNDARHLHGVPYLPADAFAPMRSPAFLRPPRQDPTMHRPRALDLYLAPHILMKRGFVTFPESAFLSNDATFTHAFLAIAGPAQDNAELRVVAGLLSSSIARYWYFMTASSWGVEREEILAQDWLTLPVPDFNKTQRSAILRVVADAADGLPDDEWQPRLDAAVADAYGLTDLEQQLVVEGLEVKLSEFCDGPTSRAYQPPPDLESYIATLQRRLNAIEVGVWTVRQVQGKVPEGFLAVWCVHSDAPEDQPEPDLTELAPFGDAVDLAPERRATLIEPIAVILYGYTVSIVKPNQLRCWTPTVAHEDAAEILSALLAA